jgi:hypothetical protein
MRRINVVIISVVALTAVIAVYLSFLFGKKKEFRLIPETKAQKLNFQPTAGTEVGTGWSSKENPREAVREAVKMALEGKENKKPDLAVIFASSGSDMNAILSNAKLLLGDRVKIYGGTSDSRAVMTEKGFVKVTERGYEQALMEGKRGLAVMTVSSKDIFFGVGSGDFSAYPSVQEAAKAAVLDAIKSAGKSPEQKPNAVLGFITWGFEEEALEGIEQVVGKDTLILGGSTGGPKFAVLGENKAYDKGISLAVIYTELPVGWTFEGGFDVTDPHSGIITKIEERGIAEIDNRPALDVYDEWLGGKIRKLHEEVGKPDLIRDLLTLHPIYRKYTSVTGEDYFLFVHPWPKDDTLKDKVIMTGAKFKVGERIYLSHGAWETLVNRIGNLPRNAKVRGGIKVDAQPILGIGYLCGGVMGTIPEGEREKLALLINYSNNNAPFIAVFTWGEQGFFPGVGSKHGNLLTSFILIGDKQEK